MKLCARTQSAAFYSGHSGQSPLLLRPTAIGPSHCHARCGAWPAICRDRPPLPCAEESHPPTPRLLATRSGSCRSGEPRAARPARRRSDDPLLPRLARSVGFGSVWSPPYTARMEQPSTTASDQSVWSPRASQSGGTKWIRSQTPVHCQSRRRRQHVIPDPHPNSCGSMCQGIPLRRANTMPVRARCETRGRSPLRRLGGIGKNSSTRSHDGSGSSAAVIPVHTTSPKRIRFLRICHRL
jgi:hypothetical protein